VPRYAPTPVDDPVAGQLLDEYFASRELGFTGGVYRRTSPDPAAFIPPAGTFLVVFDEDGSPAGCGGVRMLTKTRGEIKHLWLRDAYRGRGWGRTLLTELEVRAYGLGARVVVLDTNATLEAAQALYRSSGYGEIEPYNDNPNATHWFSKPLAGESRAGHGE
jgi:ribosomal protein S18 acetylase RimI-like enzyme